VWSSLRWHEHKTAELQTAELQTAELQTAELQTAELQTAELQTSSSPSNPFFIESIARSRSLILASARAASSPCLSGSKES